MTNLWMPGAARHPVGNTGAMNGGPARAVWHITANDSDHTFANELGWFTGGGADMTPHLLWDPFTGEVAQLFPADSRSLSLQNAGDVKTNRTGSYCIQIETVFTANETVNGKKYATVRDTPCKGLDQIMAWLRSLGIPDVWPGGAPAGFTRDTVSMDTWLTRGGHYGHNQIPGNSHVDPGPMPNLFAASPTPTPPPTKAPAFPVGIKPNSSMPSARTLQYLLKETGWLDKSIPYADNYGPATQKGVAGFNLKHAFNNLGVSYDPAIGPKGWALLCKFVYG